MRQAVRAIVIHEDQLLVMHRNKFGEQYFALVGGGIDVGETAEQALYREVAEETGLQIANPRLVAVEEAGEIFGRQYVYLCDYVGGEPALASDSEEAKITALGQNLYQPQWLPLAELAAANLLPLELRDAIVGYLAHGFPEQPATLTVAD